MTKRNIPHSLQDQLAAVRDNADVILDAAKAIDNLEAMLRLRRMRKATDQDDVDFGLESDQWASREDGQ